LAILLSFGIFLTVLVYALYLEKSGNPAEEYRQLLSDHFGQNFFLKIRKSQAGLIPTRMYVWPWLCIFHKFRPKVTFMILKINFIKFTPGRSRCQPCTLGEEEIGEFWHGDQISLWKNRPKCGPNHFLSKLINYFFCGKKWPKNRATYVIYKNCPSYSPNRRKFAQPGPNLIIADGRRWPSTVDRRPSVDV
jgi:hypothetical protein